MIELASFFWVTLSTWWGIRASDEKGGEKETIGRRLYEGMVGLVQINGYHFGSVIREKLSFHWCRPISIHKDLRDLEEFSIESQSSKRFRPRFRVTRTPLSSLYFVSLQRSLQTVSFVFPEYAIPIPEWNANDSKIYIEDMRNCNVISTSKTLNFN